MAVEITSREVLVADFNSSLWAAGYKKGRILETTASLQIRLRLAWPAAVLTVRM